MKNIKLDDKSAMLVKIEDLRGVITVELEWGGPNDRTVEDFELEKLGKVFRAGTNGNAGRSGWVTLEGSCNMSVGQTISRRCHGHSGRRISLQRNCRRDWNGA